MTEYISGKGVKCPGCGEAMDVIGYRTNPGDWLSRPMWRCAKCGTSVSA